MQLLVLREELKKERPYTSTHIIYFLYLAILSVTRFILFLLQVINNGGTADVGLAISIILLINCFLQLGYWLAKRQSLPQFRHVTPISFA